MGGARETALASSTYAPFTRRLLTFTGWNWKCHVIMVIRTDLSGFVVPMHSGLCEQYVKSLGLRPRDLTSCFARALVHWDNKPLQNRSQSLKRTARSDLVGTPETTTLPVAVEQSKSPWLLVTERSSAELEGPSWMAGMHTGSPSHCPTLWTWHLSTLPWGPDTAIQTWWAVCWRILQKSRPAARPTWQTRVVDAPWPSSTPWSVSGRFWTRNPPGCCALLADGREPT